MATDSPGVLLVQAAPERSPSGRMAFLEPRDHRVEVWGAGHHGTERLTVLTITVAGQVEGDQLVTP